MSRTVREVWRGEMLLGEGPVWDDRAQRLWFVDIKRCRVHRFDPVGGAVEHWTAPAQVGWVLPSQGNGMIAGLRTGLALFDPASSSFDHLVAVEPERPGNRLNDATVGPDGAIWFGSMDDGETAAVGSLYRFDGDRIARTTVAPVPVTNGPAFSPDGRTLYHVDTLGGVIHAIAVAKDGVIGTAKPFATIDADHGHPDGVAVDQAGNVWVGMWRGSCVRCYSAAGSLLEEVRFPVANVTKIAFGGPDLRTAYATTARIGMSHEACEAQPDAGSLFAFDVDVPGVASIRATQPAVQVRVA